MLPLKEGNLSLNSINVKFFLSGILTIVVCLSLHAGKQTAQPEIHSRCSSYIYIAENTKVYGMEHIYVKQNTSQKVAKSGTKARRKTVAPATNNVDKKVDEIIDKKEPDASIFPYFPFVPSSFSYLNTENKSAIAVSQQNFCGHYSAYKTNRRSACHDTGISKLCLLLPEQRHKLSISATQCGILTSFSPHSPSLSYFVV